MLVWIVVLAVVVFLFWRFCSSEGYVGGGYYNICEKTDQCRWDSARWCAMTDGSQGNCSLHSLCCPAFSMDHSRERTWGSRYPTGPPRPTPLQQIQGTNLSVGTAYLKGQ